MAAKKDEKTGKKKLYKSRKDKMIDGICGGIAEYFDVDVTMLRIISVLLIFFQGIGFIVYLVAMIIMQVNPEHENLQEDEKKHHNTSLFWGILLIIIGMIFLFRNFDFDYEFFPSFFSLYSFHSVPFSVLFAVVLIILGIFYVINVIKNDENRKNSDAKGSIKEGSSFFKSTIDKKISGVCGGIAEHFSIDSAIVRLGFVIFAILSGIVIGIITYIILAIILPDKKKLEEIGEVKIKTAGGKDE